MVDTTFIDKTTVIEPDWANDVNRLHYTIFGDPATAADIVITIRTETDSFTLALADNGQYIRCNKGTALTVTVPANATTAMLVGSSITFEQTGAGQVTVLAAGGVTVRTPETLLSRKQFSTIALTKLATDEWILIGDIETV